MHMFGVSVNFLEANIRLEGLDEILKATIVDKLKSDKFLQRIMQKPEQLIEILKVIADKVLNIKTLKIINLKNNNFQIKKA